MEPEVIDAPIPPPWLVPQFLTEEGLRAAQEYYFQTHGKQAKLIALGRSAQGLAKSLVRRKLAREIGEDYKLYTGTQIGEATAPEDMASLGIRGQLNALLKHIYTRIAPEKPITSPIQEDVTILKHPHGALDVCYAMVFYYGSLMRQYASFASNRRKVLKSVMDEELFKWIWRMMIGFMLRPEEFQLNLEPSFLTEGLAFIPVEQQFVPMGIKLYEVGTFLLSQNMQESHLRLALCHYYTIYLHQLQTVLMQHTSRQDMDAVYSLATRHLDGEAPEHPLVAIDVLFNSKGNSMESFDDVLKDESLLAQQIPDSEFAFINQFEDIGNPKRLAATLKRLIPDARRDAIQGEETSLMPLLLTLRVMPPALREPVLQSLHVPVLNLLRNRIANSPRDGIATELANGIMDALKQRRGESYTMHVSAGQARGAVATSVRVAPPASKGAPAPGSRAAARAAARQETAAAMRAAEAAQAARTPGRATPDGAPEVEPAPESEAVPEASGLAEDALAPAAAEPAAPAEPGTLPAPPPQPVAEATVPPESGTVTGANDATRPDYLDEPVLLAWRLDGGRIAGISLTARELFTLVGPDRRFLTAWVVFALRTGQVFGLAPNRVSKERAEQILQFVRGQVGDREGLMSPEQLGRVAQKAQGASNAKLLLGLTREAGLQRYLHVSDTLVPALGRLVKRFGNGLLDFLRNPNDEAFRDQVRGLTNDDRRALHVLQRVARAQ